MWCLLVLVGAVTAQFHVQDDVLTIDPRVVRRIAVGDCTFPTSTTLQTAIRLCFPVGTVLQLGSMTLTSGPDSTVVARDSTTNAIIMQCLAGGRCLIGDHVPADVSALAPNSLTVTGRVVSQIIGAWIVYSEWNWGSTVLQTVCLTLGTGICGTRIGVLNDPLATAMVLLTAGQVVIDNGVSASFVLASLGKYTAITQTIVRAAEEQSPTSQIPVARAPVTGEIGTLTCTVYTAPSSCGRFRWRQAASSVVPTKTLLDFADYSWLQDILGLDTSQSIWFTDDCGAIGDDNDDKLNYQACGNVDGAPTTCTAPVADTLTLGQCYDGTTVQVRCTCADAT
jgi:hypothetical protein